MKRLIIILALILFTVPTFAENTFLSDFDEYGQYVYGLQPLSCNDPDAIPLFFMTGETSVFHYPAEDIISGTNHLEAISAACCVFRCIDNGGDMIDQYGRIMHAYFMSKSRADGKEYHAATESGIMIYTQIIDDRLTVKLVK